MKVAELLGAGSFAADTGEWFQKEQVIEVGPTL